MADLTDLKALCERMVQLQEAKEQREEVMKQLNAELDKVRLILIPNMMEELQVKTATFEGVGRVQLAGDLYCSTIKGKKDEAMQWLRDCGYDDMIKEEYNATSMKALIKRLIGEGTPVPEFLNVSPFMRASIVKG